MYFIFSVSISLSLFLSFAARLCLLLSRPYDCRHRRQVCRLEHVLYFASWQHWRHHLSWSPNWMRTDYVCVACHAIGSPSKVRTTHTHPTKHPHTMILAFELTDWIETQFFGNMLSFCSLLTLKTKIVSSIILTCKRVFWLTTMFLFHWI